MREQSKGFFLMKWLIVLAVIYVGWGAFLWTKQDSFFFEPDNSITPPPMTGESFYFERVAATTSDGVKLDGWWMPTESATRTVIFFRGNTGNLFADAGKAYLIQRLGYNVVMFDYRGFGQSEGMFTSEEDFFTDGEAIWAFTTDEKHIAPENIIVWGQAVGGTLAMHYGATQDIASVVLESPVRSLADIGRSAFPMFASTIVWNRYHYDSLKDLEAITAPVLFLHPQKDEKIALHHGEELFTFTNPEKATFVVLEEGGHEDAVNRSFDQYLAAVKDFLGAL